MTNVRDNILKYFRQLGEDIGAEFYLVGGSVRDFFLGVESSDYDLVARGLSQDDLMQKLYSHGVVNKTGAVFGVIRFHPDNHRELGIPHMFEISLPRKEMSTGDGHKDFVVEFDHELSIADDIGRRDFTINAMAERVSDELIFADEYSRDDLATRTLRFLHEGSAREDPLRILRALRFISKLNCVVEPGTDLLIREAAPLLEHISSERIQEEFLKIVMGPNVDKALRYAQDTGILKVILPELDDCAGVAQNHHHAHDVFEHIVQVTKLTETDDPFVKLAALFHDIGKPPTRWMGLDGVYHFYDPEPGQEFLSEPEVYGNHEDVGADMAWDIMRRLRFSHEQMHRVSVLVRNHMFIQSRGARGPAARKLLARLDLAPGDIRDNVEAMFAIRYADIKGGKADYDNDYIAQNQRFQAIVEDELDKKSAFKAKDLAINGKDIMDLGIPQGPEVGAILNDLLEVVIEDPARNTREYLLDAAYAQVESS